MIKEIDLNCDLGEGMNNEALIMPYISSCNIACGGHAGNDETMHTVIELALKHQVKVGAHPSYPDKKNFGRLTMKMKESELEEVLCEQIETFKKVAGSHGAKVHHIKAHGALYNDLARNTHLTEQYLQILMPYRASVYLFVPYASVLASRALELGYHIKYEAFADRNYNEDLSLVLRKEKNALISNKAQILDHIYNMAVHQKVTTVTDKERFIMADTFCVHSDTPDAVGILQYVYQNLHLKKMSLAKF